MTKRKGESRSPCLMPWVKVNGWEGTLLTRIEKKVEEVRFIIQEIQSLLKPKASRRDFMYFQLSLSKDFERSSFSNIPGARVLLREWMISWTRITLSMIFLPSTYPDYSLEMMNGRMGFSLRAMTLEMIL
jgi:hypothetical protein